MWTPCILACLISAFAPETAAIVSRLASNRTLHFSQYRVRIPLTWFIEYNDQDRFSAMAAPGIARIGIQRYWRRDVPVSDMGLFPVPFPAENLDKNVPLDGATILATRAFSLGKESLNCWDLVEHNKYVGPRPSDPAIALIKCSSDSEDFYAYFYGWRGDTDVFSNILKGLNDGR
jgi:hypothetical protein